MLTVTNWMPWSWRKLRKRPLPGWPTLLGSSAHWPGSLGTDGQRLKGLKHLKPAAVPKMDVNGYMAHMISGSYIVIQYHRDLWIFSVVIYPNDWPWMWRNLDLDLITACFIFNLFTFRSYLGKMFPSRLDIPLGMTRYCGAAAFGIIVWTSRISPLTLTLSHGSDRGGVGNVGQIQTAVSFQNSTDVYV